MSDIYLGDSREVRSVLADNTVDTIITDPPYGLEFMGKGWDKGVPGVEFWKEFLAVTKPGGMLLAFGGTRTFHRMTVAIEDAGWEIRDTISWIYGSGFPKSHNLHDKFEGYGTALKPAHEDIIVARKPDPTLGITAQIDRLEKELCTALSGPTVTPQFVSMVNMCLSTVTSWRVCLGELSRRPSMFTTGTTAGLTIDQRTLRSYLSRITLDDIIRAATQHGGLWCHVLPVARYLNAVSANISSTLALSALESAIESGQAVHPDAIAQDSLYRPIIVAMKPIDGTFAENAEKWGVAGINVDGGRIAGDMGADRSLSTPRRTDNTKYGKADELINPQSPLGRWPANLVLDEEAGALLDEQTAGTRASKPSATGNGNNVGFQDKYVGGSKGTHLELARYADSGGASRFFYCAKASKSERNAGCEAMDPQTVGDGRALAADNAYQRGKTERTNTHPTVKPLKLMEYLCTLTKTPTGGIVLDPFAGSGTTLLAAKNTGREYVGIEQNPEYFEIIKARLGVA